MRPWQAEINSFRIGSSSRIETSLTKFTTSLGIPPVGSANALLPRQRFFVHEREPCVCHRGQCNNLADCFVNRGTLGEQLGRVFCEVGSGSLVRGVCAALLATHAVWVTQCFVRRLTPFLLFVGACMRCMASPACVPMRTYCGRTVWPVSECNAAHIPLSADR